MARRPPVIILPGRGATKASGISDFNSAVDARIKGKKANPVWCPIGFRGRGIRGSGSTVSVVATGTAGVNSQTINWTPKNTPIMATRLVFPNFDLTSLGEADSNPTNTWTNFAASLNFQQVNAVPPSYTFNGARLTSFAPAIAPLAHGLLVSDPLNFPIPANNAFGVRVSGQLPAGTSTISSASYTSVNPSNNSAKIISGGATPGGSAINNFTEFDNRVTTGWTDQTQNNSALSMSSGAGFTHAPFVLGLMRPPAASVVTFGDSILQGQASGTVDSLFNVGYFAQSMKNDVPWLNLSRGSMRADQFDTFNEARGIMSLVLGLQMYVTDMLFGLCRNDINSATVDAVKLSVANACLPFQQQGIATHVVTIPPWTASQDAWTTETNQFYIYSNSPTTALVAAGSSTFNVSSAGSIANGMLVASDTGIGIAPGTTVTISGTTITLSSPTTADIASGTNMNFGTSGPNPYTVKALQYNAALKTGYADLAYNSNGYVFASVRDYAASISAQIGTDYKWKAGLGFTNDGVHPNQNGTDAIVASGVVALATWGIW